MRSRSEADHYGRPLGPVDAGWQESVLPELRKHDTTIVLCDPSIKFLDRNGPDAFQHLMPYGRGDPHPAWQSPWAVTPSKAGPTPR
jgi:hypothetical protein